MTEQENVKTGKFTFTNDAYSTRHRAANTTSIATIIHDCSLEQHSAEVGIFIRRSSTSPLSVPRKVKT